jgi:hypothetical protein
MRSETHTSNNAPGIRDHPVSFSKINNIVKSGSTCTRRFVSPRNFNHMQIAFGWELLWTTRLGFRS